MRGNYSSCAVAPVHGFNDAYCAVAYYYCTIVYPHGFCLACYCTVLLGYFSLSVSWAACVMNLSEEPPKTKKGTFHNSARGIFNMF